VCARLRATKRLLPSLDFHCSSSSFLFSAHTKIKRDGRGYCGGEQGEQRCGNRLATHTTGAAPRPASSRSRRSDRHGAPRAVGAEVNPPIPPRALFARDWRDRNGLSLVWGLGVSTPRPAKLAGLGVRPHPSL